MKERIFLAKKNFELDFVQKKLDEVASEWKVFCPKVFKLVVASDRTMKLKDYWHIPRKVSNAEFDFDFDFRFLTLIH